jgi:hypothetical protein
VGVVIRVWWWWGKLNRRLGLDKGIAESIAVAEKGSLCRLCVQTGVDQRHVLENERECIRGGRVGRPEYSDERIGPHRRKACGQVVMLGIEIEIETVYNMYRMRRFTPNTVCAGSCLWALPTMPYRELTSQG